MRFHVLKVAGLLGLLLPVVSTEATTITSSFPASYYVTNSGVASSSNIGRFVYVGGNATNTAGDLPSFVVYQENGATLLNALQTASGVAGGTVSSINSLNLNLSDESTYGGITDVAGSLVFSFAGYSTTPLNLGSVPYSTPAYDMTQVGGLSSQFGSTDSLGSGTYTPAAANTVTAYPLSGAAGFSDITSAIDSGSMFYIIVTAGTSTTAADLGGYAGLNPYLVPSNLTINATVSPVPEPASLGLLATSGLMLLGRRRRRIAIV